MIEQNGLIQGQLRSDRLTRVMYSTDASIYQIEPMGVVWPMDEAEVVLAVKYAIKQGISVVPRGGGSGLAGESLGTGLIMDLSRHMNNVVRYEPGSDEVVVDPGVVLEQLNRYLAEYGKKVGPDPASGNRATIGGMIGNNATGAHSLKFGYIGEHLRGVRIVSAQGRVMELGRDCLNSQDEQVVGWASAVKELLGNYQDEMARHRPKAQRNGSGYNVYKVLPDQGNGKVNLAELMAGSEGTLGVVTQATLSLVDLPGCKGLLQVNFESLGRMARAVPLLMASEPSACELMDGNLLAMARQAYPQYARYLPDGIAASLLVEYEGADEAEVRKKLASARKLAEQLPESARSCTVVEIIDPAEQDMLWRARKAGVPLLFRNKSAAQPIPVIEDVAVDPEQLAQYIEGLEEITSRLNTPIVFYAHAGHGTMHPRPYLDLHQPEDVKKMKQLADEAFKLAWSLGGTISSEHGEGLVRVSFIKQQYGEEMYEMFRRIKQLFDPNNVLNPGKIINDDPEVMTKNLRFANSADSRGRKTNLIFRDDELIREVEQCNGNGLCRSSDPTLSMCPIFRARPDEDASPRAKGNLMRYWLHGLLDENVMSSDEFKKIADLCVNCKMCAQECPSLVNIPKLMMEARAEYVRCRGLTRAEYFLTRSEMMSRMGAMFGPLANGFLQLGWFRRIMELATGLDHRRAFPHFELGGNLKRLRKLLAQKGPIAEPIDKVAYFVDLYANYNDHELARAVVEVLQHNEVEVLVPPQLGVSMPAISYGDLKLAKKAIEFNVSHLAQAVRSGYKVICSEPTAALCLKEEYLDVVDSSDAHLVAENCWELTDYLGQLHSQGKLKTDFHPLKMKLAYHEPCHYSALGISQGSLSLMALIEGVEVERLPNSCCGIAGTFGFQKKNFDLSMTAGEPMLEPLRQSDADFGLTECGTCNIQMTQGSGKKVLHPVKVLAQSYGLL
ncbi:MAG: anaerobic glycerol-3-phosphate dehydrogenase subunit C [Sedimentisphaerales bacterium]|nr:anaerobic glycerol-3-phosphate dehydrogenase subunit C [Sedimentisphaerales bacterium]